MIKRNINIFNVKDKANNISQEIITIAKQLHAKNMLAGADGNISYRLNPQEILITPSGQAKRNLQEKDMARIGIDNKVFTGKPSSESLMHLTIYQCCPEARAVIHAHPPKSIAWSIAYPEMRELPAESLSELILACGKIPIAPYARPGTKAMGEVLKSYLPACRVILLARHGAVTWGENLQEALNGMERLEHTADILLHAKLLGGLTNLPQQEVDVLRQMREKIGPKVL